MLSPCDRRPEPRAGAPTGPRAGARYDCAATVAALPRAGLRAGPAVPVGHGTGSHPLTAIAPPSASHTTCGVPAGEAHRIADNNVSVH